MRLVALTGRKFAGKDLFARLLIEDGAARGIRVVRAAFADNLKVVAARSLGFMLSDADCVVRMDALKEDGSLTVDIGGDVVEVSGRQYLQWLGTEAHRDVFGPDFWVDALLPLNTWDINFGDADLAVVSDCRFENEALRVRELGGQIWLVSRPLPDDGDTHVSEAGIPTDLIADVIPNDRTVEDLRGWAAGMLDRFWGPVDS